MHTAALDFVKRIKKHYPEHFANCRVLEIGSANVNGTIRSLFTNCRYTGLDLYPGPDVDVVQHAVDYIAANPEPQPNTIISCEALEHDARWRETVTSAINMLRPHGGLLVITCAGPNRAEHGTTRTTPADSPATTDYYGNITVQDLLHVANNCREFWQEDRLQHVIAEYGRDNKDTYFAIYKQSIFS